MWRFGGLGIAVFGRRKGRKGVHKKIVFYLKALRCRFLHRSTSLTNKYLIYYQQ